MPVNRIARQAAVNRCGHASDNKETCPQANHRTKQYTAVVMYCNCNYKPWYGGHFAVFPVNSSWRMCLSIRLLMDFGIQGRFSGRFTDGFWGPYSLLSNG
jgi:hypothetical protein